jgi:tyrosyl-tRNA synthetase
MRCRIPVFFIDKDKQMSDFNNIYDELEWRGLVHQVSDADGLKKWLAEPGRSMYCGFDPSAKSLHIGNLVPLLCLLRFKRAGHAPIVLMGGATGRIGDPSGKDKERELQPGEVIEGNVENIRKQVHALFGDDTQVVNNYDWIKNVSILEFLRDTGKHFTVNYMMDKESVRGRFGREDVGISYTEFSYMLLQSFDYHHLYKAQETRLQIGGSDQWGNITAGAELIRRKEPGSQAFAMTFPLITTATGAKFGKSEKGAIYLDTDLTSPYEFYQFWVNVMDADVIRFMKYFTFFSPAEIAEYEKKVAGAPHLREAQKALAAHMTELIHGKDEVAKIETACEMLFGKGDIAGVDATTLRQACAAAPSKEYTASELPALPDMLVDLGLCKSKGQAKKDIQAGAVRVNNEQVTDIAHQPKAGDFLHEEVLLIKKGKKNYGLITLQ